MESAQSVVSYTMPNGGKVVATSTQHIDGTRKVVITNHPTGDGTATRGVANTQSQTQWKDEEEGGQTATTRSSTAEVVANTSKRVMMGHFGSNLCFLLGAVGFVCFSTFELQEKRREFVGATATYLMGFVGFLVSGFAELAFDFSERREGEIPPRARYNRDFVTNIVISVLFVIGTLFDLVSFFLWDSRHFQVEHNLLWAASSTWLLTSILVLLTTVRPYQLMLTNSDWAVFFDAFGNILFFLGSVVDMCARIVSSPQEQQDKQTIRFELAAASLWLANALVYLIADSVRLRLKSVKQASSDWSSTVVAA